MRIGIFFALVLILVPGAAIWADQDDDETRPQGRYFFNLLDGRSSLGKDFFPDPFVGPQFDVETQLELDYSHAEKRNVQSDQVDGEFQWNVLGELTVSAALGWEHQAVSSDTPGGAVDDPSGFGDVDLAISHPLFQFVSQDEFWDYTAVGRLDVGIPTRTAISGTDVQLTPYLGQLLRVGQHLSIQGWAGAQLALQPNADDADALVYGALLGWRIRHEELPAPLTESITPMLEVDGFRPFTAAGGQDALSAVVGANIEFESIVRAQPALSIGWQFPIDQGARDQFRWGIVVQFFLSF